MSLMRLPWCSRRHPVPPRVQRFSLHRIWFDFRPFALYLGVFGALIFGAALQAPTVFEGSPYEGWDECMAYTQATRMSLKQRFQNTTYGTVEEFKFRVANFFYKKFDPVGKSLAPRRWSNNVLNSYLRPEAIFDSAGFDGTYSRGILDRRPFLIARYVNLIGGLILATVLCCVWLARLDHRALFLVVSLLWFFNSTGYLYEVYRVTPNAWNALLAIMIFACLMDVAERRSPSGLYISAALLAFGANSKIDFLFVGVPIAVTWLVADFEVVTAYRRWIKPALLCLLLFLVTLILTNPRLLYALPLAVAEEERLLHSVNAGDVRGGRSGIDYNRVKLFDEFLVECVDAPWNVAKLHSLSATAGLGICLLFPLSIIFSSQLDKRRKRSLLLVLAAFYLAFWLLPLVTAQRAWERYFLSGSGIAMVSVGYACRNFWNNNSRVGRAFALVILCLCFVSYIVHTKDIGLEAIQADLGLANASLDRDVSRNQAVLEIIRLIERGNYAKQVIIDQHSYTDVRAFLEKGIPVKLINVFNFQRELEEIRGDKQTLGLYVPGKGSGSAAWEGKWNDQDSALYDRYLNYLLGFETVAKFGSNPMFLLDWGPVDPADEVVIFETNRPNTN
jgi:hypothetical protein